MEQDWVPYIIIAAVALALIAVTIVIARLAWRRQVRSFIVGLVGRRASIDAALNAVESVISTLSTGSVEELLAFAETESDERRALAEIAQRMQIESAELADLALPRVLWPLANELGRAAGSVAEEASRVGDAEADGVLDALSALDLGPPRAALGEADSTIAAVSTTYDLTDPAVYGGGLYI